MSEAFPKDVLLRVGGAVLARHGIAAVAGSRRGSVEVPITMARADASTCATTIDRDGIVRLAAANVLRVQWEDLDGDGIRETPGLLLEGSRTQVALWNRDLTNAAWVKTGGGGVTAVKDQTGIDGVASSASRITATGANGTCLQSVTLGSSQRAQTVYIKRLVGSGNIDMTMDNGATWTTLTGLSSTAWLRKSIPTQTLANPILGFRIVTNTDSVAIDFVQNEGGAFESSAIATTTGAVTRAADAFTLPFNFGPLDCTVLARMARPVHADLVGTIGVHLGVYQLGTTGGGVSAFFASASRSLQAETKPGSNSASQNLPAGQTLTLAAQHKNLSTAPQSAIDVGSGYSAFSAANTAFSAYGNQTLRPGFALEGGSVELYGVLLDLKVFRGLFTLAEALAVP